MHFFSGKRPVNLGLDASGKLKSCPKKPNCVCSQSEKISCKKQQIEAIEIQVSPEKAINHLVSALAMIKGIHIVTITRDYLYAEGKTPFMGFVDDLEFSLDIEMNVWHVRSASRLGSYDFGKNRQRIEQIRRLLT